MSVVTLLKSAGLGAVFALAGTSAALAATIVIETEIGTAMETEFGFRSDTGTRGIDLAGAQVTATFSDGTSETATWMAFDPYTTGGANGDRWSLFQGETAQVDLVSDGRLMTNLTVDLSTSQSDTLSSDLPPVPVANGASVFDILPEADGSTDGSAFGFPFAFLVNEPAGEVTVTYSGAVNIVGAAAVGDLFTTMSIDFTRLDSDGFMGSASYWSDQDTLLVRGDLRQPSAAVVPLPAGLPLLLAGLGGLGLLRRARKGQAA